MASAGNGTVTINPDGTLTYVPMLGFEGSDIITYRIGDGQGGFANATVRLWVTADPAAKRHVAAETIDDVQNEPMQSISADGMVLDAIDGLRLHDAFDYRVGSQNRTIYDVSSLSSFSLKIDGGLNDNGVKFETFVRDQTLTLHLAPTARMSGNDVREWSIKSIDGRPMPAWLSMTGGQMLIGKYPANIDLVDLKITAILADGTTIANDVRIRTSTGELTLLRIGKSGDLSPLKFWEQIKAEPVLEKEALGRLVRGLVAAE